MGLISRVSSRTYRKKNQKNNTRQTWPLAKTSVLQKDPKREVKRRSSTHSPKKTGTPSKPQPSSKSETSATLWSPEPLVTRSPLMDLKDESTTATKPTSTTTAKDTENSNSSAKMSKAKNCILNFHGMSLTRDKMCGMVKKWQTMIQCAVDAKTTDNYHLRVFVVAFTKKQSQGQIKKTTYAQSQQ